MNTQTELFPIEYPKEAYGFGQRSDGEIHGVVLTKPHVVELILDLAGFTSSNGLSSKRLLEPSCGHGAFLLPAVRRLLEALQNTGGKLLDLEDSIVAFDIDSKHVGKTKDRLVQLVVSFGYTHGDAIHLINGWVHEADFLLAEFSSGFDFIVGNPPYIRIEQISPALQAEYRRRYNSLFDRADLYVAFIERSLSLLNKTGLLSFVCADRWILNRYGAPFRQKIVDAYQMRTYIDLHKASPFHSEVIAYPSIFVIGKGCPQSVKVMPLSDGSAEECNLVRKAMAGNQAAAKAVSLGIHKHWFTGAEPWALTTPKQLGVLRELEQRFPLIEDDGNTKVKIGVATGCDKVFIVNSNSPIEKNRIVPLVMRHNLVLGKIKNSGRFVINTFNDRGQVVNLNDFPKLRAYLESHSSDIKKRHVAKKNKTSWFRTIDRVYPELVKKPKLLIPDIAGANEVTFDAGSYHPHHNLYFVTSESWDLEVLGGLLSSKIALFFVWSYAVKMRGGYLRFQAQYLRRIRVPEHSKLSKNLKTKIKSAFRNRSFEKLDRLALEAYKLEELPNFDFVDTRK